MNYLTRKLKKIQQLFVPLFQNSAFFMQGQMNISPESRWFNEGLVKESGGFYPLNNTIERQILSLEPWDNTRRDMIILLIKSLIDRKIAGEFVELGVFKGHSAKLIHYYTPERNLHLFDTFDGFPKESMEADEEKAGHTISKKFLTDTSLEGVKEHISPQNNNVSFYPGFFPETVPDEFKEKRFAFVHLDADLYQPVLDGLKYFYDRLNAGGFILVHDYNAWIGARKAVDEFCALHNVIPIPMPDKSGSALIQKY